VCNTYMHIHRIEKQKTRVKLAAHAFEVHEERVIIAHYTSVGTSVGTSVDTADTSAINSAANIAAATSTAQRHSAFER